MRRSNPRLIEVMRHKGQEVKSTKPLSSGSYWLSVDHGGRELSIGLKTNGSGRDTKNANGETPLFPN